MYEKVHVNNNDNEKTCFSVVCCDIRVSPRESEWDADVSHGSRESQLSSTAVVGKADWGGGPSYGVDGRTNNSRGGGRDYSLLSPAMPRKGSVVTFDVGKPGVRRHSSPIQPIQRKAAGVSTMVATADCQPLSSALKYVGKDVISQSQQQQQSAMIRYVDDYRTLTQLRKRSAGDQSIISVAIDEDDSGEEEVNQ